MTRAEKKQKVKEDRKRFYDKIFNDHLERLKTAVASISHPHWFKGKVPKPAHQLCAVLYEIEHVINNLETGTCTPTEKAKYANDIYEARIRIEAFGLFLASFCEGMDFNISNGTYRTEAKIRVLWDEAIAAIDEHKEVADFKRTFALLFRSFKKEQAIKTVIVQGIQVIENTGIMSGVAANTR